MNEDYSIALNFHSNILFDEYLDDEFRYVEEIFVDIMIHGYNDEDNDHSFNTREEKIGYLQLHYYNLMLALNNGFNIFDAFDRSMHTVEMGEILIDMDTGEIKEEITDQIGDVFYSNILVIHDFGIFPAYRNRGIGERVLKSLLKYYQGRCGVIALKSFPKQHEGDRVLGEDIELKSKMELHLLEAKKTTAQQKLNTFYKKCGFTRLKKNSNFFVFNLD